MQNILKVLKTFRPDFEIPVRSFDVDNKLINDIYEQPTIVSLLKDFECENN